MTNRDHSPSISQNDGGDAKLRTEGSGLDLDALLGAGTETDDRFLPGDVIDLGSGITWRLSPKMATALNRQRARSALSKTKAEGRS